MSNEIHRKQIQVGMPFKAPVSLTFGWQEQRHAFSVWYRSDDDSQLTYAVVATGSEYLNGIIKIRASCVMPGGFTVFHLCEVYP